MKTAAIYTRVSSDRQKEEHTIGSQVEALLEYAQAKGYAVPSEWIFQDEGYSGSVLVRPGLERIRDLAAEGQVEAILAYSPDRLSRNYAHQVLLIEELSRHGVEVVFIKSPKADTPEGQLLLQFQGMIAEYERALIVERSRRGKRFRAKSGVVNVLSGAPYGYHYVKKTEIASAYYEIIEEEAKVVGEIYRLYTEELVSIGEITRRLNAQGVPTRKGISPWERTTVWAILRNPAYIGKACYGKTETVERKKITRLLRKRGGYSPRCSSHRERPREEWIEIAVPAIIKPEVFDLAQGRLEKNKQLSARGTKEPTLLQGMLVCSECGYAFYRTSTRTSKKKIYYYRCLGSDNYRYQNGRVCSQRPVRQDYMDDLVWKEVMKLLKNPELIKSEIDKRIKQAQESSRTKVRKETLLRKKTKILKGIDRLLDAYQDGLIPLSELRKRIPGLRKKQASINSELQSLEAQAMNQEKYQKIYQNMEMFLSRLQKSAENLDIVARRKILQLVVKEILVGPDNLIIKHSIPTSGHSGGHGESSYLLCKGSSYGTLSYPYISCSCITLEDTAYQIEYWLLINFFSDKIH